MPDIHVIQSISTYPDSMAIALRSQWMELAYPADFLPDAEVTGWLLDTVYQASLMREEGDDVLCRIIVAPPSQFSEQLADARRRPNVLRFCEPCEFTPPLLRKLALAADYYRALLAVEVAEDRTLSIWGMVVTGTEWVNQLNRDDNADAPLPHRLVIQCVAPGHLIVAAGCNRVLEMAGGRLLTDGFDPFRSSWLPLRFRSVRESMLHELAGLIPADDSSVRLCDSLVKDIAQSVIRRVLRLVRTRGHGGMLVYVPERLVDDPLLDRWFRFRVRFEPDDAAHRFRRLMLSLMERGWQVGRALGLGLVTWNDYRQMRDAELVTLDESLIDYGHFLADLMSVDGTLVLDRGFRLVGFGAEILGETPVAKIHRALDLEAERSLVERADTSGTRHRSAYRLVSGMKEAIAIVVSQDGDVRFVAHHRDRLTYWPYLP